MSNFPGISKRMEVLVGLVEDSKCLADVGCDHGYVGIAALLLNKTERVIACDINEGPLDAARSNARVYGTAQDMDFRLANGLVALEPDEADTVIIAGMGGRLIADILSQGEKVAKGADSLILSPQSDIPFFRNYLLEEGYQIECETMLKDEGKYYYIIRTNKSDVCGKKYPTDELSMMFGGRLLADKDLVLKEYLEWQLKVKEDIFTQISATGAKASPSKVENEIDQIKRALEMYES